MIYSRKNKRDGITYWFIRYDLPDGRRKKEKAGTTKQDAKDRLIQRKSEILKGEFLDPKSRGATFAEFASRFLDDYGDTKLSAYYRQTLTKTHAVMRFFGKMQLDRIAESDLERFRRERSKTVGPSTAASIPRSPTGGPGPRDGFSSTRDHGPGVGRRRSRPQVRRDSAKERTPSTAQAGSSLSKRHRDHRALAKATAGIREAQ